MSKGLHRLLLVAFVTVVGISVTAWGQEYRATITGVVTDTSKAVIPGATITVRNLDTGEVTQVQTNGAGVYTVPFLHPGHKLEVSAEAKGFKKLTYPPVVLSISQVQTADFVLEVGSTGEVVTVTSDAYQVGLDTATADRGLQVNNKTLTNLPLENRNVLSVMDTLAGITDENGAGMQPTPTDMYYVSQFTVNGGATANVEYLIDGQPNDASPWYNNGPSSVPTIDALQELKVITNPYDAQLGHSAGGVVSMELKSGTNAIHGTAWEYYKRTYLDANSWLNNYNDVPRSVSDHREDTYGFEVGGPVFIPHFYDGRDKTFFMISWERFKAVLPQYAGEQTVDLPNPAWLQGDFTNFTDNATNCGVNNNAAGCLIPVYDPMSRDANGNAQIFQFGGVYNKVDPTRFNPIAVNLLTSILSNPGLKPLVTVPSQYPWETIWSNTIPQHRVFNNILARADQKVTGKDQVSFNLFHGTSNNVIAGTPPGVAWQNGENFKEYHFNVGLDWVHTFRSNLLLDFHTSYNRYWRSDGYPSSFSLASMGFDPGLAAALPFTGFPNISFSMQQTLAASMISPGRDFYYMPDDTYSYAPTLTWLRGKHTLRSGIDIRSFHVYYEFVYPGDLGLNFDGFATSQSFGNGNNYNPNQFAPDGVTPLSSEAGNAILDFLLSQPYTAQVVDQKFPYFTTHYFAPWVQDDWKLTDKLTLNLGLRYDLNGPPTSRDNLINTGFNLNAVNPIDSSVNRTVDPSLPTLKGGYTFANSGRNTPFNRDYSKIQPRIGFAYQLNGKTVLRGGYGRLVENPAMAGWASGQAAAGFSANVPYVNSPDGGVHFYSDNLTNPFANNGISSNSGIAPIPGSSLGLLTNVGAGIQFMNPNFKLPYVDSFSLGIQRATHSGGKLEVSYVGTRSKDQPFNLSNLDVNIPFYKSCDRTTASVANPDPELTCTTDVANPFYQVQGVTGGLYTNQTYPAQQFQRPYPEFTSITEYELSSGHTWYNSLQTTYRQRVSWLELNAAWTWSKNMQSLGYVDQEYLVPQRSIVGTDRKNRVTLQSVLDIPVGRGRAFFSGMNKPLDAVIGGWHLGNDFFWESGNPLPLPSGWNAVGNLHAPKSNVPDVIDLGVNSCYQAFVGPDSGTPYYHYATPVDNAGNPCSDVTWQQTAYHSMVTEQPYTAVVRAPSNQQLDTNLFKTFKATERVSLELRLETFNTLNHPTFQWAYNVPMTPNANGFGTVQEPILGQGNNPRQGQLALKVLW
jgi:hypothetical protein